MEELPERLLHRIMSFLTLKEAVQTSILSRKFYSVVRSLPVLQFKYSDGWYRGHPTFHKIICEYLRYFSSDGLKKLSIHGSFNDKYSTSFDVIWAAIRRLEELELKNCYDTVRRGKDGRHFSVRMPGVFFLFGMISVLTLEGFRFRSPDLALRNHCGTTKLRIARSLELYTVTLIENISLEALEIDYCEDMKLVEIDASNLEIFKFLGPYLPHKCEIGFSPHCTSLRTLRLKNAHFSESLLQENSPIAKVVENLFVKPNQTMRLKRIHLDWPNLKHLEFTSMPGLENIEILPKNLQSCVLNLFWSPTSEIKFNGVGTFLEVLTITSSETITGGWIEQNLPNFRFLENLELKRCSKLEQIKIRLETIKSVKIIICNSVVRVDIDAPLLESLEIKMIRKFPSYMVIPSGLLRVRLSLYLSAVEPVGFEDLRNFLTSFNNCKELTLDLNSCYCYDLMFGPEAFTGNSPLYDLKKLNIELGRKHHNFSHLMGTLLWLVPHPECITFISSSVNRSSIKFEYADFERKGDDERCCYGYSVKCWRHKLRSIQLSNFKSRYEKETRMKQEIKDFLRNNAPWLDEIQETAS